MDHRVQCECGRLHVIPCFQPRHNKAGQGYHGSKEMTKLNKGHVLAYLALENSSATSYRSGLTSWGVYEEVKRLSEGYGLHPGALNSVRGRLSEMQGESLRLTRCEKNNIELKDPATQTFRFASQEKWFLHPQPTLRAIEMIQEARERFYAFLTENREKVKAV